MKNRCDDGLSLPELAKFGDVWGSEGDANLVSAENPFRDRIETKLPEDSAVRHETFDLITTLDVLEHLGRDQQILADLVDLLWPEGRLLIAVPASMLLWDRHDEINHHFRRDSKSSLLKIVPQKVRPRKIKYLFHGRFAWKLRVSTINRLRTIPIAQHTFPPAWISPRQYRSRKKHAPQESSRRVSDGFPVKTVF